MGYLFLGLANICGAAKGYCGKMVSNSVKKQSDAMLASFLRMLICGAVGLAVVAFDGGFGEFKVGLTEMLISAISGLSTSLFVVSWLFAVRRGAYMLVDVFLTVGLVVPIALCSIFFGETIEWNHCVGFLILTAAVAFMCSYSSSVKSKLTLKSFLLLFLCGISQGISSFTQKWFVYKSESSVAAFNFYTYIFAAIALFISYMILEDKKNARDEKQSFSLKPVFLYIAVMAVMLFFNSYFMTLAATTLNAVLLYPVSTGVALILSTVMSAVFFKERPNINCIIGVALAFASIILMNFI